MSGRHTLWLPGCDHAGIATQSVVEKQIWREELKTRHDYGREAFVQKIWDWKNSYGDRINLQFRRMGISVDWDRYAFTLDPDRYEAVIEAFVRLYDKDLIYRATRLVNWSCHLKTAISDLEVEYMELDGPTMIDKLPGHDPKNKYEFGALTEFAYKIKGSDQKLVVATTRLETMLGDVAVAVHPEDPRYKDIVGKELEHPFFPDRVMKVIADDVLVDMSFGTGAVKITPAHDPNDYKCGLKHKLPMITVINESGAINELCPQFAGMMRFDARNAVYAALDKLGLIIGKKPNPMRIGRCSKSNDIIEPLLKPQWYMKMDDMAARSCEAVRNKTLKITPESHESTWFEWLGNIQDWCISRQLWWGHRIPVYLATIPGVIDHPDINNADHYVVGRSHEEALERAAKKWGVPKEQISLAQDEDVLDTWFSSGIFPFSVMGWPKETDDMKAFFPGDILETGHDILFFWVARMVMMSLELTDKLPFHTVVLHPMVRDEHGAKMSKSKGNVIDPLEVIDSCNLETLINKLHQSNLPQHEVAKAIKMKSEQFPDGIPECGTDALRFALLSYMVQSSINLDVKRVVGYREFGNKLWNITKFALQNFPENFVPNSDGVASIEGNLSLADKWILTRLSQVTESTNGDFQEYKLGSYVNNLYDFWKKSLADVYLEAIKPVMKEGTDQQKAAALNTLYLCLDHGLKMLHPAMPYITEELFQRLPHEKASKPESITIAPFPKSVKSFDSEKVDEKMDALLDTGKAIRSQLASLNVPSNARPQIAVQTSNAELEAMFQAEKHVLQSLVKSSETQIVKSGPEGFINGFVSEEIQSFVNVAALIDIKLEITRIEKKQGEKTKLMAGIEKKIANPAYMQKVPEKVRNEDAEKLSAYKKEFEALEAQKAMLAKMK